MGFQTDFLTGIAELLDTEDVGTWSPAGTYTPGQTGIFIDQLGTTPERAIGLILYQVQDSGSTDSIIGLQLRIRGSRNNRTDVKDTTDQAFNVLHDLKHIEIGGTPVVRVARQSGANLPRDGNNRQEATENYYLHIVRTGTHRAD